jgi:copper oxidase (laccase) domain-containing protein
VEAHFAPLFPEWQPITGKRLLNLAEANRWQMCAAGIQRERIFDCRLCTTCNVAEFFSYRKEPENPGRLVSSICRLA